MDILINSAAQLCDYQEGAAGLYEKLIVLQRDLLPYTDRGGLQHARACLRLHSFVFKLDDHAHVRAQDGRGT